ncbi:ABC transporter ATP-binding protein [Alcaligenes aquatilis]|jgi:branched-chain amino acid transport system ATP-binding protein|uniref:ATP-binding cassette domain-containing protein n=3 Tax=Alcaligenes TaxID=507 RepID=A0A3G2HWH4_9BURK|nr:ATP-binding cassette domain-containing protein [Alcaligenes aquatilis]AYN21522.1 ATP-binding cassette domain-containing protein [Alcaligenes aquatilis]WGQ34650.1 ATP-binding cassette domain-containing protein [Alcaligenes faecalis]HRK86959.1 ATP-binding cassette domain-containing protein [Alcaligenes faecalis]
MMQAALDIENLYAWHREFPLLRGLNLQVASGEICTVLSRNRAGRSAMLRAIVGLTDSRRGSIRIQGTESIHLSQHQLVDLGVGYSPYEQSIFTGLSCEENLLLPPAIGTTLGGGMSLMQIYELLPSLEQRRHHMATQLSTGEQKILAIARLLRTGVNLLLLDKVSEGLAPVQAQTLIKLICTLRDEGYTVVLAEQCPQFSAAFSDRFYVLEHGQIVERFTRSELSHKYETLHALLGD